jgi:conjugal transfer pilin signal peptidase TrbI
MPTVARPPQPSTAQAGIGRYKAILRSGWLATLAFLTLVATSLLWLGQHYQLGLNASHSLPHRLYLIERGQVPARGDLVAFRWAGGGPYPAGTTFIKEVSGIGGDPVHHQGNTVLVKGMPIGQMKSRGRNGQVLLPGPTGTVPAGHWFVSTPHPDSLDSRYALTGWVSPAQLIGRAHALF